MRCPHCSTENRDDRVACYHCGKDLTLLRLIQNKAKAHFNAALEHAEQSEFYEALGDLNAALELDARFAEALVLRGTILARLDRTTEARESLNAALALNPQALRAHRYLETVEQVQPKEPLLKRLNLILGGAAAVAAVSLLIALIVIVSGGESSNTRLAREGWQALQIGDYAEARRLAVAMADNPERNELLQAIDVGVQTRLDIAARYGQAQQYRDALGVLRELEELDLPDDLDQALNRERNRLRDAFARSVIAQYEEAMQAAIDTGSLPESRLAALRAREEEFMTHFPVGAERLAEARAEVEVTVERLLDAALAQADSAFESDAAATEASSALRMAGLWARFLGREEAVGERLARLNAVQAERLYAEAATAAREGNQQQYDSAMVLLRALPLPADEALTRAAALRSVFAERELTRLTASLRTSLAEGSWRHALQAAESINALGGTLEPQMQTQVERARTSLSIQSYYDLMAKAGRIEAAELTKEEAEQVLAMVEEARGPMPPRLADRADESLHFFAAVAHRTLEQQGLAEKELEHLKEKFPESPYLLY